MSLSNSVKIHLLDPNVHNSARSEWRLEDAFWASSLKLVDVGVYSAQVNGDQTGLYYSSINGVLNSIKNITLFSGSTVLDQVQELAAYGSVKNLMVSNQGSEDVNRFQLLNGISLSQAPNGRGLTTQSENKDYDATYDLTLDPAIATLVRKNRHNNQIQIAGADGGVSGMLLLSDYLEMLKSVPVLSMLPDLRIVIEWNVNAADYYNDAAAPAAPGSPVFTPIRPQLMAEEVLGQVAPKGMQKIPYVSTMVERFVVPTAADGTTVATTFRSGAFRQRYVKDLIFYNQTATADGWMLRNNRSVAQKGEKLQLVLNGRKYLPDQGIDQEAVKMQYFNQTLGSLNVPLCAALSSTADVVAGRDNILADATTRKLAHNMSVTAVGVNDVVDRLDIEYQRVGSTLASDQTASFNLLVFGHVQRLLEVQDGKIRLSY
jgi:hypothetical protein